MSVTIGIYQNIVINKENLLFVTEHIFIKVIIQKKKANLSVVNYVPNV